MKELKLAISGDLGSGKSVTSKYIANKLRYEYFSTGDIQRQMAHERNVSILEMNKLADINYEIDRKIDEAFIKINLSNNGYVLDSRLAWYFVNEPIKFYLRTNLDVTVNRIFFDKVRKSEAYISRELAKDEILERKKRENARFLHEYGVECDNLLNYDFIIETTSVMPDVIGDKIIELSNLKDENISNRNWVSPKFLFPLQSIRGFGRNETKEILNHFYNDNYFFKEKILCIFFEGFFFILDGHKRVSAALRKNIPLIPIDLVSEKNKIPFKQNTSDFLKDTFNMTNVYDWEDVHDFRFEIYPQFSLTNKI